MSKQVQLRGGFSDRNNIQPLNDEIQLYDFDERTRVAIANLIHKWYEDIWFNDYRVNFFVGLIRNVFSEFLSEQTINNIKYYEDKYFETYIYEPLTNNPYDEVLTLLEYIVICFKTIWESIPYHIIQAKE